MPRLFGDGIVSDPSNVVLPKNAHIKPFVDPAHARQWVQRTLDVGDSIRRRIFEMGAYVPGDYEKLSREASQFLEKLGAEGSDINFASILRVRAEDPRTKDQPFLSFANRLSPKAFETYTYQQADAEASRAQQAFDALGIGYGARVVIRGVCPEHLFAQNGLLALGATVSPLTVKYNDNELRQRTDLINADVILTVPELLEQTDRVRKQLGKETPIILFGRDPEGLRLDLNSLNKLRDHANQFSNVMLYDDVTAIFKPQKTPIVRVGDEHAAFSMMTSGSSGQLKDVRIPHSYGLGSFPRGVPWWGVNGAATEDKNNSALRERHRATDVVSGSASPGWMYFNRGMAISQVAGAHIVMTHSPQEKRDPKLCVDVIQQNDVSVFAGIPSIYAQMLRYMQMHDVTLPSLRRAISTGEPIQPQVMLDFMAQTSVLPANGYAATEEGPMAGCMEGMRIPIGVVGVPLPGVDILLMEKGRDPGGIIIGGEKPGEIAIKKTPISGRAHYPNGPDGEKREDRGLFTLFHDGSTYRHMNDSGTVDARSGAIKDLDRQDGLLKRLAIQVFPFEINRHFASVFADQTLTCTVGVPDPLKTNSIVTYMELPKEKYEKMSREDIGRMVQQSLNEITEMKRPDYVFVAPVDYTRQESNKIPVRHIRETMMSVVGNLKGRSLGGGVFFMGGLDRTIENLGHADIDTLANDLEIISIRERHTDKLAGQEAPSLAPPAGKHSADLINRIGKPPGNGGPGGKPGNGGRH
jgi:acyl-coenzyme A synthetase/AMP-(fatty) acid ligase